MMKWGAVGPFDRLSLAAGGLGATGWKERVRILGQVGMRLLDARDPLRIRALAALPADAGISSEQAVRVLDGMARDWTPARLEALVRAEFEAPEVLDGWVDDHSVPEGRRIRAFPLAVGWGFHICAGTVPGVSVTSLIRGLLVGGPVLLKPGIGDGVLPAVFVDGLREEGGVLGDAVEIAGWRGGAGGAAEEAALADAGAVIVYGGPDTVAALRRDVSPSTPIVAYGHRVGVAVLGPAPAPGAPAAIAAAVAAFEQRGCVSPRQLFVVGPASVAHRVATEVAGALEALASGVPAPPLTTAEASAARQLHDGIDLRIAAGDAMARWSGADLAWTVVLDPAPRLRPSGPGRVVHVTPIDSVERLDAILSPMAPFLQTVGVAGFDDDAREALAERVGRLGASRVVPFDRMSFPPAWWIHDGQGPLRRLVRWATAPTRLRAAAPRAR